VQVQILFLGRLQDVAGKDATDVEVRAGDTIGTLIASFDAALAANLSSDRVRIALNGVLTARDAVLADGDEVAFLPPVSGG
jgi:molybdopterin synthase sulfur carrier subunit